MDDPGGSGDSERRARPEPTGDETAQPGAAPTAAGEVTAELLHELTRRNTELLTVQRARDEMASRFIHDMRSPMMVISANLEFALSTPGISAEARDEALADSRQAAVMLSRLIESLMHVTRLHSGRYVPKRSTISVEALLGPVCARAQALAAPLDVDCGSESWPDASLTVDVPLLTHALEALTDHVLERTPPNGAVRIACRQDGTRLTIRIGSTAPSMSAEERDQLFDRLGGADIAGARAKVGAGLYLCRLVAEAHGGSFALEDSAQLPTSFSVRLPVAASAATAAPR